MENGEWRFEIRDSRFEIARSLFVVRCLSSAVLTCLDNNHLDIRHFFHRKFHAFAPESTVAIAAVRHVVGAETRNLVDDDAAEI